MDNEQLQTLLQHVLHDPEFVIAVTSDAVKAFATLGIVLDPKDVPTLEEGGVKLPPRRAIIRALKGTAAYEPDSKGHVKAFVPDCGGDCK